MYTISNNSVTFRYTTEALLQRLKEQSAQISLTQTAPNDELTATDAYAITDDEATFVAQLLNQSAQTAAEEFDKIGEYRQDEDTYVYSAPCGEDFVKHAPLADAHLTDWLAWHTLTRWLHMRHLDKPATWTLMQATVAFAALHRDLFLLRS